MTAVLQLSQLSNIVLHYSTNFPSTNCRNAQQLPTHKNSSSKHFGGMAKGPILEQRKDATNSQHTWIQLFLL